MSLTQKKNACPIIHSFFLLFSYGIAGWEKTLEATFDELLNEGSLLGCVAATVGGNWLKGPNGQSNQQVRYPKASPKTKKTRESGPVRLRSVVSPTTKTMGGLWCWSVEGGRQPKCRWFVE